MIKRIFSLIKRELKRKNYNKKHGTDIQSRYADLRANYGEKVRIGKNSYIGEDCLIGDYSYINTNSSLEKCTIGKFCSISSGVYINPYEHDYRRFTTHPFIRNGISDDSRPAVVIGNDVLISLNVVITAGVTVGDGAVIGAGAIVTNDVRPYEIVGGVPAKHIKWRFEERERQSLLQSKWWDWKIDDIYEKIEFLEGMT